MKNKLKLFLSLLGVLVGIFFIYAVLQDEKTLVVHPQGIMAAKELKLIQTNISLMLIVIIPTLILLFLIAWKYRDKGDNKDTQAQYEPEETGGAFKQLLLWIIPAIIVAIMAPITWHAAHELDPYKPLNSSVKPLTIQVIALDWKWLFIYPEQNIATLNFVQFPTETPIRFEHAADRSPMNSFWIPQLSGQIYSMTGMVTPLHIMADRPGEYAGKAAEINGDGYADMTFVAKATSSSDFDKWVASVKQSPLQLTEAAYNELSVRSIQTSILHYSTVEKNLFNNVVMKYMYMGDG
jgi:cytochrome o ubiquinol oxidase subunit 2